jgi:hypothetical protein
MEASNIRYSFGHHLGTHQPYLLSSQYVWPGTHLVIQANKQVLYHCEFSACTRHDRRLSESPFSICNSEIHLSVSHPYRLQDRR